VGFKEGSFPILKFILPMKKLKLNDQERKMQQNIKDKQQRNQ
jgi:hypothetical protein